MDCARVKRRRFLVGTPSVRRFEVGPRCDKCDVFTVVRAGNVSCIEGVLERENGFSATVGSSCSFLVLEHEYECCCNVFFYIARRLDRQSETRVATRRERQWGIE